MLLAPPCASPAIRCCARTALPVERFETSLKAEIERMGELMNDAIGSAGSGRSSAADIACVYRDLRR